MAEFVIPYDDFEPDTLAKSEELNANFAAVKTVVGTNEFSEENVITSGAPITANLDALDLEANRLKGLLAAVSLEGRWWDPDYPGDDVQLGSTAYRKVWAGKCVDGSTQGFLAFATLPDVTRDYQLVIECAQSTSLTGKYIALKVEIKAIQDGEDPAEDAADISTTQAIACKSDTTMLVVANTNFKITSGYLHTDHQLVRVGIWRVGGSSSPTDDHTGDTYFYRAYFKAVS